jgi:hypothetical protein
LDGAADFRPGADMVAVCSLFYQVTTVAMVAQFHRQDLDAHRATVVRAGFAANIWNCC